MNIQSDQLGAADGAIDVFPEELDAYLTEWFYTPALFSPTHMFIPGKDLLNSAQDRGWPVAKNLRDRFSFCVSGTEAWKSFYSQSSPHQRLCFADLDFPDNAPNPPIATSGTRIVANMHVFTDDYPHWKTAVSELRAACFFVRAYLVNSAELWAKARSANVNVIATDDVKGDHWANVGSEPFSGL